MIGKFEDFAQIGIPATLRYTVVQAVVSSWGARSIGISFQKKEHLESVGMSVGRYIPNNR